MSRKLLIVPYDDLSIVATTYDPSLQNVLFITDLTTLKDASDKKSLINYRKVNYVPFRNVDLIASDGDEKRDIEDVAFYKANKKGFVKLFHELSGGDVVILKPYASIVSNLYLKIGFIAQRYFRVFFSDAIGDLVPYSDVLTDRCCWIESLSCKYVDIIMGSDHE